MSYYIKQTRGSINTLENTNVNGTLNNKEYALANNGLSSSQSYYIKFTATMGANISSFYLKIANANKTLEQTIQAFGGTGNQTFETVFSPNTDGYTKILWQQASGTLSNISSVELKELQNIVPKSSDPDDIPYITKLGVQGPPSLLMCINGEKIRIGKSKIYQLDDKNIKITSLCFCPKSSDFFIADYEYYKND